MCCISSCITHRLELRFQPVKCCIIAATIDDTIFSVSKDVTKLDTLLSFSQRVRADELRSSARNSKNNKVEQQPSRKVHFPELHMCNYDGETHAFHLRLYTIYCPSERA